MKTVARRSFLRLMGAAPLAATAAASSVKAGLLGHAAELTGASVTGYGQPTPASSDDGERAVRVFRLLSKDGFPDWKIAQMRQEAKFSRLLDADIAAMHSWSLRAKMAAQEDRNFERIKSATLENYRWAGIRDAFLSRVGIGWL